MEVKAAALGEELDLAAQRSGPERDRRLVGGAERYLGLPAGRAAGEQRLSLPELRIGCLEGILQPLPGRGCRLPPLGVGPSLQPGLLGLGEQQMAGDERVAGLWCARAGEAVH